MAKVGNNAAEFFHPEEIVATNYGMISDKETDVKSPVIMKKIGDALLGLEDEPYQKFYFLSKEECGEELVKEDAFLKDMIADTPGGNFNR